MDDEEPISEDLIYSNEGDIESEENGKGRVSPADQSHYQNGLLADAVLSRIYAA